MVHGEARPDDFGALLVWHRRSRGTTQDELAAAAQISVRAISNIERGRTRGPQRRSAEALADTLQLTGPERDSFLNAAERGRRRTPAVGCSAESGGSPWPASALCTLPNRVSAFTGRGAELARLDDLATKAIAVPRPTGHTVVISGFPGIGKTSLATSAAHPLRGWFPDGQFFLDLHGTDDTCLTPREALDRLLRALGIAEHDLPRSTVEKVSVWRWLMRERRSLVVLDDAAGEAQVRPLLPEGDRSLTVITSRKVLAGLDTTHQLSLGPLTQQDSVAFFAHLVGDQRAQAEPKAVRAVAELCEGLPVALRIAGNRLRSRPHSTIQRLVEELSNRQSQLSALTAGDTAIRSLFASSYRNLGDMARLVLRRLALIPGQVLTVSVAAFATGLRQKVCEKALAELEEMSLLDPTGVEGRYRFSGLLKNFSYERLVQEDSVDPGSPASPNGRLVLQRHLVGL